MIDEVKKPNAQDVSVADVVGEGCLRADGFGLAIGNDKAIILAICQMPDVPAHFAEPVAQDFLRQRSNLTDGVDAHAMEPLFTLGAHSPNAADWQRRQETLYLVRRQNHEAVWFGEVACQFRKVLVGRHANRGDQARFGANAFLDLPRDLRRRTKQPFAAATAQERFIEAQGFDTP